MSRAWQTSRTQNPVLARGCGFKSHLRYYKCVLGRRLFQSGYVPADVGEGWAARRSSARRGPDLHGVGVRFRTYSSAVIPGGAFSMMPSRAKTSATACSCHGRKPTSSFGGFRPSPPSLHRFRPDSRSMPAAVRLPMTEEGIRKRNEDAIRALDSLDEIRRRREQRAYLSKRCSRHRRGTALRPQEVPLTRSKFYLVSCGE